MRGRVLAREMLINERDRAVIARDVGDRRHARDAESRAARTAIAWIRSQRC